MSFTPGPAQERNIRILAADNDVSQETFVELKKREFAR
jgi:hypothetical protein